MLNASFTPDPAQGLAALAVIIFIGVALYIRLRPRRRRRSRRNGTYSSWQGTAPHRTQGLQRAQHANPPHQPSPDLRDPAQQMHAIARVEFECTPLLNQQESRLLPLLESVIRDLRAGHRVMAQTSLGELLRPRESSATESDRSAAFASINSKRLDFAIIDRTGRLAVAVEYQGDGHHQGNAFMRDAVKREAVRRAGIPFVEVEPDFDPTHLRTRIMGLLTQPKPAAPKSTARKSTAQKSTAPIPAMPNPAVLKPAVNITPLHSHRP